jgi:hypothetical protein
MEAWILAHPWMTFFLAIAGINAVSYVLSPPCVGWRSLDPACQGAQARLKAPITTTGQAPPWPLFNVTLPAGNGVFHGLVRRTA